MRIYLDTEIGTDTFVTVPRVPSFVSPDTGLTVTTRTVWDAVRPINPHTGAAMLMDDGFILVVDPTATDAPAGTVDLGDPEQALGTGPNGMARVLTTAQSRQCADAAGVSRPSLVGATREEAVRVMRAQFWAAQAAGEIYWDDDDGGRVQGGPRGHRLAQRYDTLSPARQAIVDGLTPARRRRVLSITPRQARLDRIDQIGGV